MSVDYSGLSSLFTMAAANLHSQAGALGGAIVEEGEAAPVVLGVSRHRQVNSRLYGAGTRTLVDQNAGANVPIGFTVNRVLPADEAFARVYQLADVLGIDKSNNDTFNAFINSLLLCIAANSSSERQPGRATFSVGAGEAKMTFNLYSDVIQYLGDDFRRFERAYANVSRKQLEILKGKYDRGPRGDSEAALLEYDDVVDQWNNILHVAYSRGLSRIPTLCFDGSDACTGLTHTEKALVAASKPALLPSSTNALDSPVVHARKESRQPGAVVVGGGGLGDEF